MPSGRLTLLDGFELTWDGSTVLLPLQSQRLLAFLALQGHPVQRTYVAGTLWSETTDTRSAASLRTNLWRIRRYGRALVTGLGTRLAIGPAVEIDIRDVERRAQALLGVPEGGAMLAVPLEIDPTGSLLPDWHEDWVIVERERFRQLHLHALERSCVELTRLGRFAQAIAAGLAAIAQEPLHETAHRVLIQAYLAEGNRGEALRQYDRYVVIMRDELQLAPSASLTGLFGDVLDPVPAERA